jgi:hypothetical protein
VVLYVSFNTSSLMLMRCQSIADYDAAITLLVMYFLCMFLSIRSDSEQVVGLRLAVQRQVIGRT